MKNWEEDDEAGYCAAAADLADAQAVAAARHPLHTVNFATEYWDRCSSIFLAEYRALRTPNPDVLCNREIKFRAFLDMPSTSARTGSRPALCPRDPRRRRHQLRLCADADKDQTYFLHLLDQAQLARTLFPLADLTKAEVRGIARGTRPRQRREEGQHRHLLYRRAALRRFSRALAAERARPDRDQRRAVLGEHRGLAWHTIGQRSGLGIGGVRDAGEAPWFVAAKDAAAMR
jgi:tRNA-specific 2-thiouridylase